MRRVCILWQISVLGVLSSTVVSFVVSPQRSLSLRSRLVSPPVAPKTSSLHQGLVRCALEDDLRAEVKSRRSAISELEKKLRDERSALTSVEDRLLLTTNRAAAPKVTESPLRSLVKAVGWRFTAGFVTFCTSLYYTGNWATAGAIVGSDFATKSGTMYIGERLFNKVQVGRSASGESPWRSVIKALIWRAFAAVQTMIVSLILIKEAAIGAKIAGTDAVIKTILMILYDQVWAKIDWGRSLENLGGDGI